VKHFKNSQQIDYATDHGNSYADRERNFPMHIILHWPLQNLLGSKPTDMYVLGQILLIWFKVISSVEG
jgi:hypothetical protein